MKLCTPPRIFGTISGSQSKATHSSYLDYKAPPFSLLCATERQPLIVLAFMRITTPSVRPHVDTAIFHNTGSLQELLHTTGATLRCPCWSPCTPFGCAYRELLWIYCIINYVTPPLSLQWWSRWIKTHIDTSKCTLHMWRKLCASVYHVRAGN